MAERELFDEMLCAQAYPDATEILAPLGLDRETTSGVGVSRIRVDEPGLYVPDDDAAVIAAIIPVIPGNELIDLIALGIRRPRRWWRRTGFGDLLGESNARATMGLPITVHPGPLEWLRAGCEGVVILEFTPSLCGWLTSAPAGLVVDDLAFGERLDRMLSVPAQRPRIFLPRRDGA